MESYSNLTKSLFHLENKMDREERQKKLINILKSSIDNNLNLPEDQIRESFSNTAFAFPYKLDTLENPGFIDEYIVTSEEIESYIEQYQKVANILENGLAKFLRLQEKVKAFMATNSLTKDIEPERLFKRIYRLDNYAKNLFMMFMLPTGGSYGYNKYLERSINKSSTSREDYLQKIERIEMDAIEIVRSIPSDIDDLVKIYDLNSEDELAEAIFYLSKSPKLIGVNRYINQNTPESFSPIAFEIHPQQMLEAGRKYKTLSLYGYEPQGPQGFPEFQSHTKKEKQYKYNPDLELPESDYRGKGFLINKFIDEQISNYFERYYEKTDKEIINATRDELQQRLVKSLNERVSSLEEMIQVYGFPEFLIKDIKSRIYSNDFGKLMSSGINTEKEYSDNSNEILIHSLITNGNFSALRYIIKLSESKNDNQAKDFFKKAIKEQVSDIDFRSEENAKVDILDIITEIDRKYGEKIRQQGLQAVFPYAWKAIFQIPTMYGLNFDIDTYAVSSRSGILGIISKIYKEKIRTALEEQAYGNGKKLKDTSTFKEIIFLSRIKHLGFSGYRKMNQYMDEEKENYEPFDKVSEEPNPKERARILNTLKDTVKDPENISEIYEAYDEYIKRYKDLSVPGLQEKKDIWNHFLLKVIGKLYRQEEAYITGKTNQLFDKFPDIIVPDLPAISWDKFLISSASFGCASTPITILKTLQDGIKTGLIPLFVKLSSVDEFNSIERMEGFLLKLVQIYNLYKNNRDIFNLRLVQPFPDLYKKITGTKEERIEKILQIANLLDNYQFKEEIVASKYIDKINLDIIKKAIKTYAEYKRAIKSIETENKDRSSDENEEEGEWVHDVWVPHESSESSNLKNTDFINVLIKNIQDIREKTKSSEDIFPKDMENILLSLPADISLDKFIDYFEINIGELSGSQAQLARAKLARLSYGLSIYGQISTVMEYYNEAEKKNSHLFDAEFSGKNFRFRVLRDLDPYHFQVGADTDCCQMVGGAGEQAAVDSFVNSLAGVIVLEVMIDGEWQLVSQSYFHYVPRQNIFILDNIEAGKWSEKNSTLKSITGYNFPEIYALLGQHLKEKGYQDVLVGINYTKVITRSEFKRDKRDTDLRRFKVDDPYTDYEPEDSISLSNPKFKIVQSKIKNFIIDWEINKTAQISRELIPCLFPSQRIQKITQIKITPLKKALLSLGLKAEVRQINKLIGLSLSSK